MSDNGLVEKREYTQRAYTPDDISVCLEIFMAVGGSIKQTKTRLKALWGFSPTEPTIRKWLQSSTEAMNLLDQRTALNLQNDIAYAMEKAYELLINELESGTYPAAKVGTLYAILIDKWLLLNRIRNEQAKAGKNDIIADELLNSDKKELLKALINETSLQ